MNEIYAFVVVDRDGTEHVCECGYGKNSEWLPMVGTDLARLESLRPYARLIARKTGQRVQLVCFTERREIETIAP